MTLDLKSILNPTATDLLTVVRLGNRFALFERELEAPKADSSRFREDLNTRLDLNREQTADRFDTLFLTIQWPSLLLMPLILFFANHILTRRSCSEDHTRE